MKKLLARWCAAASAYRTFLCLSYSQIFKEWRVDFCFRGHVSSINVCTCVCTTPNASFHKRNYQNNKIQCCLAAANPGRSTYSSRISPPGQKLWRVSCLGDARAPHPSRSGPVASQAAVLGTALARHALVGPDRRRRSCGHPAYSAPVAAAPVDYGQDAAKAAWLAQQGASADHARVEPGTHWRSWQEGSDITQAAPAAALSDEQAKQASRRGSPSRAVRLLAARRCRRCGRSRRPRQRGSRGWRRRRGAPRRPPCCQLAAPLRPRPRPRRRRRSRRRRRLGTMRLLWRQGGLSGAQVVRRRAKRRLGDQGWQATPPLPPRPHWRSSARTRHRRRHGRAACRQLLGKHQ